MGDEGTTVRLIVNQKKAFSRSVSHAYDELHSFRTWLKWMFVDQSTGWTTFVSWFMYILFTIVVPCLSYFGLACPDCDSRHTRPFDKIVQLSLSAIATLSFLCLSRFISRYGLRRFLFFDRLCDESETVSQGYTEQLNVRLSCEFYYIRLPFPFRIINSSTACCRDHLRSFSSLYCLVLLPRVLTRSGGTAQEEHKYLSWAMLLLVML